MTIIEMLEQSGVLTLLGMGIVFGFLIVLIAAVILAGKIIHALGLDKDAAGPQIQGAARSPGRAAGATAVAAVITAAVNEYRKTNS
jgi:oxaloacetate decarboxylase gamma subunit